MIRSMTGYGKGECCLYDRRFTVEIKSVNHRYNDITIKLPRSLGMFEDMLRKRIASEVQRGKTDVYVTFETFSRDDIKITLNEPVADAYIAEIKKLKERHALKDEPTLSIITRLPDIFTVEKSLDSESELSEALMLSVEAALNNLIMMRENEGAALLSDIMKKLENIELLTGSVEAKAPDAAVEYYQKLKTRLLELLSGAELDENRMITESAILADKACIDEEVTRLKSHISQLKETLKSGESIGRKMDFIVQEMNREVNTIGSKSGDMEITKLVVELKSEIEKIREQMQNVE